MRQRGTWPPAPAHVTRRGRKSWLRARRAAPESSWRVTRGVATTTGRSLAIEAGPMSRGPAPPSAQSHLATVGPGLLVHDLDPHPVPNERGVVRRTVDSLRPSDRARTRARRWKPQDEEMTSAPKKRVKPAEARIGPKPSPALSAARTAPRQSGSTPSWFAAKVNVSSPALNSIGSSATTENRCSSSATAWRWVRPRRRHPRSAYPRQAARVTRRTRARAGVRPAAEHLQRRRG